MSNFLLWVGGLLVVLLCALFAVPYFVDWNGYRGAFEEEASRILGREVRVAGKVNLRVLPTPFVRFEKVRLSDQEGVTGEPFFRADDFTLWLAPGALLRGALEANRIELHRPILKLRLNADGGGNWQTFSFNKGSLPFVVSDIALQSVSISDGAVSIDGADGTELVRADAIGGEITASAVNGPFKFRGQANWHDEPRSLRLSTGAPEPDGSIRFKLNVGVPRSGNAYALDGRIADFDGKPNVDGALTGTLQVADGLRGASGKPAAAVAKSQVDLKAQLTGDAAGLRLADIVLAFDQDGPKPQSLTGALEARWQGNRSVDATMTSRWLDIDKILGWAPVGDATAADVATAPAGGLAPLTILRQMSTGLAGLIPAGMPARVSIAADAVTLAADTVNNVKFGLERTGDQLRLSEFRAGLPGSTRVEATGVFPSSADPAAFDGDVVLRGANLGRFLTWAGVAPQRPDARNEGAFSLRSKLITTAQSVAFREITADLAGTVVGGSFQDDWSKRRRIDVQLEGSSIDLSSLAPGSLDFSAWRGILQKPKPSDAPAGAAAPASGPVPVSGAAKPAALPVFLQRWLDPAEGDLTVQVRAGRLVDGSQDLRDVALVAAMKDGRLSLSNLRFQSADSQTATLNSPASSGLIVEAEGELSDLNRQPSGALRGWVVAQDGAAVTQLMTLLGLSVEAIGGADQTRLLAPSRIAWTARFGNARAPQAPTAPGAGTVNFAPGASANAPASAVDLTLDGALLGRRLMAVLRMDGGLDGWRRAPIDATLTLDGPDFPRLVQLLKLEDFAVGSMAGGAAALPSDGKAEAFGQGRLSAKIVGRSADDILADIRFNDDGVDWSFTGRASAAPGAQFNADGEVRITAADLERAIAQAGLGRNASLANLIVDGSIDVFVKDGRVRMASRGLTLNGSNLLGDVMLSPATTTAARRLDARLSAADASLPRMLDLLLDSRGAKKPAKPDDNFWSRVPFDLTRSGAVDANIQLLARQLTLTKGLGLQNATLDLKLEKGRLDVAALDGTALNGRLTSKWSLAPAATGVIAAGSVTLTGSDLKALAMQGKRAAAAQTSASETSGQVDITVTLSGQGASPAAVIASLTGKGLLDMTDVQLSGASPSNVKTVIDAAMAGKLDVNAEALEKAMQRASTTGRLPLGKRSIGIEIVDGAARVAPLIVVTPDGQATNRTAIDLSNFKYDIEWRLDVAGAPATPPADTTLIIQTWPRVSVVQLGHLGESDLSVQRISVQALTRELTVRKMERDVAELERLRRLDEERIGAETERLKAAEAAKAAAVSANPEPAPGTGVPGLLAPGTTASGTTTSGAAKVTPVPQPGRSPLGGPVAAEPDAMPARPSSASPSNVTGVDPADAAKRRSIAIERRQNETRRPPPARAEPFRQGASP
jgi:uncharacterized protein involved in outer membrane biogenesis